MEEHSHDDSKRFSFASIALKLRSLRMRTALIVMMLLSLGVTLTFFSSMTLQVFYQEKLADYLAVMYLELEQQASIIGRRIQQEPAAKSAFWDFGGVVNSSELAPPSLVFSIDNDGALTEVHGRKEKTTLDAFNLKHTTFAPQYNVLLFGGETYLSTFTTSEAYREFAKSSQNLSARKVLILWKIDLIKYFQLSERNKRTTVYVLSREGKLLYTDSNRVTPIEAFERPLVRAFIRSGVNHGQAEFLEDDVEFYGFYYEVPRTNLIIFNETSLDAIRKPVETKVFRYVMYSLGIALVMMLIFYITASVATRPLKNLARLAERISSGDFTSVPKISGSGEVADLSIAFRKMINGLKMRDFKLQEAFEEHKEKVRLEGELKVTQHIQKNFLPKSQGVNSQSVEISAKYLPAEECAGDWYFYKDFDDRTLFCIADVSGYGVGSAMFTAIIASIFDDFSSASVKFDLEDFSKKVNKAILNLGSGKWHATLQVGVIDKAQERLELLNMGHPPSLLSVPDPEGGMITKFLTMPSDPAGIVVNGVFSRKTLDFPKGSCIFAYSDGLIEAKNASNKAYGMKSVKKLISSLSSYNAESLVLKTIEDWSNFRQGVKPIDDLCLISVRFKL